MRTSRQRAAKPPGRTRHKTDYQHLAPDVENVMNVSLDPLDVSVDLDRERAAEQGSGKQDVPIAWKDVQSFRQKISKLDAILSSNPKPIHADQIPVFTDKELMAAPVCLDTPVLTGGSTMLREAEAEARERLKQEVKTMLRKGDLTALRRRAFELGVSQKELERVTTADADDWHYKLKVLQLQAEYKRVVSERVVQGESLPPGWFVPAHTRQNMSDLVAGLFKRRPTLPGDKVWGGPLQEPSCTERHWLLSPLWQKLDEWYVYIPIYLILVALAVVSPVLIFQAGKRSDTHVSSTTLTLSLHAMGSLFFWWGFVMMFHNLREVVRLRTSWLRQVAQMMGVGEKALENSHLRKQIINLIVQQYENQTLWNETLERLHARERETRAIKAVTVVQLVFRMKQKLKGTRAAKAGSQQHTTAPRRPARTPRPLSAPPRGLAGMRSNQNTSLLSPVEFLQIVPVFQPNADVDGAHVDWQAVAELADTRHFEKGDVIVLQGAAATDLFILQSGSAEAWKGDIMTSRFSPMDYFGERAWRPKIHEAESLEYRGASIVAAETSTCLVFPKEDKIVDRMRNLVPFLVDNFAGDKHKHAKIKVQREEEIQRLYNSYDTFTHIEDRGARLLLDAMVDASYMRKMITASSQEDETVPGSRSIGVDHIATLEKFIARDGEQLCGLKHCETKGFSQGRFLENIRIYLNHQQDVAPPSHNIGEPRICLDDSARSALSNLRWSSYTERPVIDRHSYDLTKKQMHRPTILTHEDIAKLQRARRTVSWLGLAMYMTHVGYAYLYLWPTGTPTESAIDTEVGNSKISSELVESAAVVLMVIGCGVATFIFASWFCSLLLAVALVTDEINDLRKRALNWAANTHDDDAHAGLQGGSRASWYLQVQNPVLELAHTTLPALSAWGEAIGSTFVCFWLFALLSLPLAARQVNNKEEHGILIRYFMFIMVTLWALAPIWLLYGPASVSSATDNLLDQLNELRTCQSRGMKEDSLAQRAAHLIEFLDRCNNHFGPGFMMFGTVVSLRFLKQTLAGVAAMGSTVVVYLVQMGMNDADLASHGGNFTAVV